MKEKIGKMIAEALGAGAPSSIDVSVPEMESFGHFSTNVAMRLSGGGNPLERAKGLAQKLTQAAPAGFFEKVEAAAPGFVNFWLSPRTIQAEFKRISEDKSFGKSNIGKNKTVIVEYSSPNIAKTLNVGHLRNTVLGSAIANILEALGYKVVRWNYLGDWGTQFGKLIAAYKAWGDKKAVEKEPLEELQKLYVRFHEEEKLSEELAKRGQEEFKKLENGDKENIKLWEWFREESIKELKGAYEILGAKFDVWTGESFFNKELKPLARELVDKKIAERSEGALVIRLDEFNLPPALIEKSDGASVYFARDIANLRHRLAKYKPAKILYVIGNEQALIFEQLFAVAKKLALASAELVHVKYGLVLGESGKKLSTREGRTVSMKEIVEKATRLAQAIVQEKNSELTAEEKDEIAETVALGAIKYVNLKENRTTDIVFDWGRMLDLGGDSAPYIQYTYARLASILRKAKEAGASAKLNERDLALANTEPELTLMRKIFEFPNAVAAAGEMYSTSALATYAYKLAVAASRFYETTPVIKDENVSRRAIRLALVAVAMQTLSSSLALLGINVLEKI